MDRPIHTIDAQGVAPGRLATRVATLLIGKQKVGYTPHLDDGDQVKVVHVGKMKITGNKMRQKIYRHHTTYASGLKEVPMERVWSSDPGFVLRQAVWRMLPKNKHRRERMKRLMIINE